MLDKEELAFKVRENRLRRIAKRQRLELVKTRRRDSRAWDYGTYSLMSEDTESIIADLMSIDQVAKRLGDK